MSNPYRTLPHVTVNTTPQKPVTKLERTWRVVGINGATGEDDVKRVSVTGNETELLTIHIGGTRAQMTRENFLALADAVRSA